MKSYLALVEKDEGSAFGVRFPDIPGVFSAADTEDGVLANAIETLQLWAEDMPLPIPSPHQHIVQQAEVRDALAGGAYLISVPLIEDDTVVVRANVTFERGVLKAIDTVARERGMTRSAFLASAARKEIEAKH